MSDDQLDAEDATIFPEPQTTVWRTMVFLLGLVFIGAILFWSWKNYGKSIVSDPRFTLVADRIEVTPTPEWIGTDIVAEVIRDGSLERVSLLDLEATVEIKQAFAMHSWVESVERVSKHANGHVTVDLNYRQPVGMVKVVDPNGRDGHFPVDGDGVLLPTDISRFSARQLARIEVGETWPSGPIETSWGDKRVIGAASIVAALGPAWQQLRLATISTTDHTPPIADKSDPIYLIHAGNGLIIIWGHAPQKEAESEASADDKVIRLVEYVRTNGPLEKLGPDVRIDLSNQATIKITRLPQQDQAVDSR